MFDRIFGWIMKVLWLIIGAGIASIFIALFAYLALTIALALATIPVRIIFDPEVAYRIMAFTETWLTYQNLYIASFLSIVCDGLFAGGRGVVKLKAVIRYKGKEISLEKGE